MKKKNTTPVVVQSHALVSGDYTKFNAMEMKIFKLVASKVGIKATLFRDSYFITKQECTEIGVNPKNIKNIVLDGMEKLANIYIIIKTPGKERRIGLIRNDFSYHKQDACFEYSINNDLITHLLSLGKDNPFSAYRVTNLKKLTLKEDIKLFELLNKNDEFEMRVAKLCEVMELSESYIKNFGAFNQKLKKVINKIEAYTNLKIEIKYNKKSNAVHTISFRTEKLNEDLKQDQDNQRRMDELQLKMYENLELKNGYLVSEIDTYYHYIKFETTDGAIKKQQFQNIPEMLKFLKNKDS